MDFDIALSAACEKIVLPPRPLTQEELNELEKKRLLERYEQKKKISFWIRKTLGGRPRKKRYPKKNVSGSRGRAALHAVKPVSGHVIIMAEETRRKLLPLTAEEIILAYVDHRKKILDFGVDSHPNPEARKSHYLWYQVEE
jgi:hypothetical protein